MRSRQREAMTIEELPAWRCRLPQVPSYCHVGSAKFPVKTGLSLTDPLVGDRRRFRRGLSAPAFETQTAESWVTAGSECALPQLHAVVTRVRVSDNLARIIACG